MLRMQPKATYTVHIAEKLHYLGCHSILVCSHIVILKGDKHKSTSWHRARQTLQEHWLWSLPQHILVRAQGSLFLLHGDSQVLCKLSSIFLCSYRLAACRSVFFSRGNNLQQRGCKDLPKICPKLHAFPDTRRIYGQLAYSIGKPKSKPNNKNTPRTHYCRASAVCSSSAKETSGSRVSYCTSWPFGAVG